MTAAVNLAEQVGEPETWAEQNQEVLVAAVAEVAALLAQHLGHADAPTPDTPLERHLVPMAALDAISAAFELSPFERAILTLCAGVELDARVARLCREAGEGASAPTFGLALATLPDPHWSALSPDGPLRRWQLVELTGHGALTVAPLRIDEHVLHVLTGLRGPDPRLAGICSTAPDLPEPTERQQQPAHALAELWRRPSGPLAILTGADRASRLCVASHAARDLGLELTLLDASVIPADPHGRVDLARMLERASVLSATVFVLDADDDASWQPADVVAGLTTAPLVVSAAQPPALRQRPTIVVDVPRPTAAEQRQIWRSMAGPDAPVDELVAAFDLDTSSIGAAVSAASDSDALWSACRAIDRPALATLAERVRSDATWDDLVVPPSQRLTLGLLVAHARHRVTVYDDWGLARGRSTGLGNTAVFGGPSGTGKSFAAEVVAGDLGLDLYRVDLSAVVSKYIGETEKNLRRVFDAADHGAAVLLFDEADALFGKRTEVRDSHDRYANVEVSYLLQRMEAYRGLAILTTNMAEALDAAFMRRISYVVRFPFPDAAMRRELWERAFPSQTPTEGLDLEALAQLDLAGGTIRNVAVNSAFLAAAAGEPVRMAHVVQAARIESDKLGQPMSAMRWDAVS